MWYVIPFVILLVVAIILKKREDNNKNAAPEKNKKAAAKRTSKQPAQRKQRGTSLPVQQQVINTLQSGNDNHVVVPVSNELKAHIENLIQLGNYTIAEAKINQALNQDNQQHELYSYLIELHTLQHDEFALKQLANYLRSINLYYLADEADEKREALQQVSNLADVVSAPLDETPRVSHRTGVNVSITNFDALARERAAKAERQEKAAAQGDLPSQSSPFLFETEQLPHPLHVEQAKSDAALAEAEAKANVDEETTSVTEPTAHFVFSSEQLDQTATPDNGDESVTIEIAAQSASTETSTDVASHYELDFFLEEVPETQVPSANAHVTEPPAADPAHQPLEFDLSDLQLKQTTEAAATASTSTTSHENEPATLDFDFDLASTTPESKAVDVERGSPAQATEVTPNDEGLDFSFDLSEEWGKEASTTAQALEAELLQTTAGTPMATADKPLDFDLDFSTLTEPASASATPTDASQVEPSFGDKEDFHFDLPQPNSPEAQATTEQITRHIAMDEPVQEAVPDLVFDFDVQETSSTSIAEVDGGTHQLVEAENTEHTPADDPLTQSFPELLQIDEHQLSLDLAAQYVKLGAYADAKALLEESLDKFTDQQREVATKLLREIDS